MSRESCSLCEYVYLSIFVLVKQFRVDLYVCGLWEHLCRLMGTCVCMRGNLCLQKAIHAKCVCVFYLCSSDVCVCVCARARLHVCMCVREREREKSEGEYAFTCIHMYIRICVCKKAKSMFLVAC